MVLNQNPKQKVHTNTKNYFDQSENLRATATPCFEYKTLVATIKKKKKFTKTEEEYVHQANVCVKISIWQLNWNDAQRLDSDVLTHIYIIHIFSSIECDKFLM